MKNIWISAISNFKQRVVVQTKPVILALQPLFPAPIYFSVLTGHPPLWLSLIISVIPFVINYGYTRYVFKRTLFDIPILIFISGMLVGFVVSPDKSAGIGALSSTVASILVYYGIANNRGAAKRYWFWTAGIICFITLILSLWFLSQSDHRVLGFNRWAFNLFTVFPKTKGPVLQLNTIGALLAVVIPVLFVFVVSKNKRIIRFAALILWLIFVGVLFISDSGAGWLAVLISLGFILIIWRKRLIWLIIPVGGLLGSAAIIFYGKAAWLRMTFSETSLTSRFHLWQNTLTLLRGKAAIFGLGPGNWLKIYADRFGYSVPHVHNSYLQLYCDAGILGLIAMVFAAIIFIRFSISLLKLSRQNPTNWVGIGLVGSFIAGSVFAIFDVTYTITDVTAAGYIYLALPLLWIGAALVAVVDSQIKLAKK